MQYAVMKKIQHTSNNISAKWVSYHVGYVGEKNDCFTQSN